MFNKPTLKLSITLIFFATLFASYFFLKPNKVVISSANETPLTINSSINDIVKEIKDKNPDKAHPRLIARQKDFDDLKNKIKSDPKLSLWFKNAKKSADKLLTEKPVKYELPDGVRLLSISRKALDRIQTLAGMYKLTGEVKYAERAWLELRTICDDNPDQVIYSFDDWHPVHFLDTAEMTNAAAIGYDWLYDYLTSEQRVIVKNAIIKNGLNEGLKIYKSKGWWSATTNNWNGVCNGGMTMGAIAIADEDEQTEALCGFIIKEAVNSLPIMLNEYAPDGAWFEGPSYWDYATSYFAYMISSLDSALGTDLELSKKPGLNITGYFPMTMSGPLGTFNFADANASFVKSPVLSWLSRKYNNPDFALYHDKMLEQKGGGGIMDIIWNYDVPLSFSFNKQDTYFSEVETVAGHSNMFSSNESFVAFKAGTNGLNHGDLDIGSFIFDALGVRWALDLGPDDYNLSGYFDMKNSKRFKYYRKSAQGHNTIIINPSLKPDQDPKAQTKINNFKSFSGGMFAITDMTPAYKENANSVKRGIALIDGKKNLLIQDEINNINPSEVWWSINTKANIKISENGRSAILTQDGKQLYMYVAAPEAAVFEEKTASPLPGTPIMQGQNTNNGIKKLAIHLDKVKEANIRVYMVPVSSSEELPSRLPNEVKLKDWETPSVLGLSPSVFVGGLSVDFDTPPIIEEGTTLVPMRAIFEKLDANIGWDDITKTVTATLGSKKIILQIGSDSASVNGTNIKLLKSPKIVNGRTMVPLRFISEALGKKVDWDGENLRVNIN